MGNRTCIVLGSSPLGRAAYAVARRDYPDAPVITCNRGLQIEPNPDFYFLSDMVACELWAEDARQASKRGKTQRVTLRRDPQAMKTRSVGDFEIVIREGHPYEPFQLSGWQCVEFAVRVVQARTVVLVGMDGYAHGCKTQDYFAGAYHHAPNDGLQKDLTRTVVEPLANRVVAKYPEVRFECRGEPCYSVKLPNWAVVPWSR
jgi:hypothetical protein